MAEQSEQILIEVKFDSSAVDTARKALQQNINELQANKKELREIQKEVEKGNSLTEAGAKRYADLNKQIEENKRAIKSNTAIIQASSQARATENDSLDMQRQYLNTLQKAFAGLTKEQKDAMGGAEELSKYIKSVSDNLRDQEMAIGENGRNVGNYAESMQKAFGEMAHAGELLSPAVSLLRGMGGEGKKAAAALDALSKVMQLAGKAGKVLQSAQQAQAAATQGATVAQEGLNAAMSANPIGLIVAGISTLLPLVQSIVSAFGDATAETEKFNNELERQNRLIEQAQSDAEFEAKVAGIFGASAAEQLRIRQQTAVENLRIADEEVERLMQIQITGSKKEREAAAEAFEDAQEQQKAAQKALEALNQEATLQNLKDLKKAEEDKQKVIDEAAQKRREKQAEINKQERDFAIEQMESLRLLLKANEALALANQQDLLNQAREQLANFQEEEEEEDIPTVDEMARNMFGLDQEGVDYFKNLLDSGFSYAEAKDLALKDQTVRTSKAMAGAFGAVGDAFTAMGNMIGEFSEDSEEGKKAAKAFAWVALLTSQAEAIANTVAAITQAIANAQQSAAATGPAAVFTAPAFIAEMVAITAGATASAISGIVQAKQLISQAEGFETGGIVGGTSYHGDHVPIMANSREMILPTNYQEQLFDALSSSANGERTLGFDYELMAAANASLPAPVMVLKELEEEQDKVSTFNEIASV